MKNPYGVEPTRYMKREGDNNTIYCHPSYCPTFGNGDEDELINEMKMIGIELNDEEKEELKGCFYQPQFTELSKIIDDMEYDRCLQKWTRCHKWKLLFRASDHEYKAKSFHEFCDDKGPTLVVIKSTSGYIFGGYTTQSWSGGIYHYMRVINRS